MNAIKGVKELPIIVLLLLGFVCLASALEASPAGGGWLEVSEGGYVFAQNHDDFDVNLQEEFTFEMWFYLKRQPRRREGWMLLWKEGGYLLELSGHMRTHDARFLALPKDWMARIEHSAIGNGGSSRLITKDDLPLNRWHYLAWVHGSGAYQFYLNGKASLFIKLLPLKVKDSPLHIGGTATSPFEDIADQWVPFTGGIIDEVRISNKARYPLNRDIREIVPMPRGRLEPDEHTVALWHFDGNRADWLDDASGNEHALIGANLVYYSVEPSGKLSTVWGHLKQTH